MAQQSESVFELYTPDRDLTREQVIAELAAMPDRARELVAGLDADALTRKATPDAWSALEVCLHLRDAAQVYGMRFKWMIIEDSPLLAN